MKRIKKIVNLLGNSLSIISLSIFIWGGGLEKAFCQTDNNETVSNTEEQRLKAMEARNSEINSLLVEAVELYKQKQFEQAVNLFHQVIRLDQQNASAHFSLGITLEAMSNLNGAADEYAIAHEIDPGNRDYQRAILNLKNRIEKDKEKLLDKQKQESLSTDAAQAFKEKQYERALSLYQTLEKENPNLAFAKYNIGTIYLILKKPDYALNYYKEAHKLDPDNKQYTDSLEKLKENIKKIEEEQKAEKSSRQKNNSQNTQLTDKAAQKNILSYFGLRVKSDKNGVLIEAILTGSRAAKAGLQPGDIIQIIDGLTLKKSSQLEKAFRNKPLGQRFQLLVLRRGQTGVILF